MRKLVVASAVLTLLLAPVGAATWSAHGSWEPDYEGDASLNLMWREPDFSTEGHKVYFNAYVTEGGFGVNPGTALLGGRILPATAWANAYLGFWKDCNHDGYIGAAESALSEYPVELLSLEPILGNPETCTTANGHIREGWVYEFIWIGNVDNVLDPSGRPRAALADLDARVWADQGLPGQVDYRTGGDCSINPPEGSLSSTGGIIGWLDCDGAVVRTTMTVDEAAGTSVGFGDSPTAPACSNSPLNVGVQTFASDPRCDSGNPGLLGHESDDERPLVLATQCDTPTLASQPVDDPSAEGEHRIEFTNPVTGEPGSVRLTDSEGNLAMTPTLVGVGVPSVDADGSAFDSANRTAGDVNGCTEGPLFAATPETTIGGVEPAHRNPDLSFQFVGYDQMAVPLAFAGLSFIITNTFVDIFAPTIDTLAPGTSEQIPRNTLDLVEPLGETPPNAGAGVPQTTPFGVAFSPGWWAPVGSITSGTTVRGDGTPAGAAYITFYAYVGTTTLSSGATLPSTSSSIYGAEWCQGATSGTVLGFDCDAANWWDTSKGAADENAVAHESWSGRNIGVRVGQPYQLRDTDCYDGSLSSAAPGVGLGLAPLSAEGPCA